MKDNLQSSAASAGAQGVEVGGAAVPSTHDGADPTNKPLFVSPKRAAFLLGTSIPSIYRLVGRGDLEMVKDGRASKIPFRSVEARAASLPPARIKPAA
jgi:hypothetical protein